MDAEDAPAPRDPGWRTSRRTSRTGKSTRKTARRERENARRTALRERRTRVRKQAVSGAVLASRRFVWRVLKVIGSIAFGGGILLFAFFLLVTSINSIARWEARRHVGETVDPRMETQDNLLVIGVDGNTVTGFLALRVEEDEDTIFGIAIPDAAFMEVPGQGFERAGDSFKDGPEVSASAISNFLSIPFDQYVVVSAQAYQSALQNQSLVGLLDTVTETNLTTGDVERFARAFKEVSPEQVALVPLPVKPISLGDEIYFEPQRDEVADLLYSWWGVSIGSEKDRIRVIVYNGSGIPGIAGAAAQELIRQGFRVVETRNAENFEYEETLVVVYHGEDVDGEKVRDALGVGVLSRQEASQQVADVIVIIGKDYSPPEQDG